MADKFTTERVSTAISLGLSAAEYTPADTDLPINVKAVVFDADGTMSYKNAGGSTISGYPVKGGIVLAFVPARITAMSGPTKCFLIS